MSTSDFGSIPPGNGRFSSGGSMFFNSVDSLQTMFEDKGIVVSGLLVWMKSIMGKRDDKVVECQTEMTYNGEEVRDAKNALWDVSESKAPTAFQKFKKVNINKGRNGDECMKRHISDLIKMLKILDETQETPILLATPIQMSMCPIGLNNSEDKDDVKSVVEKFHDDIMKVLKKNSDDIALLKSEKAFSRRTPSVRRNSESFFQDDDTNSRKKIRTDNNLSKDLGMKSVESAMQNSQSSTSIPSNEWSTVARKPPSKSNQSKNNSKPKNILVGSADNKELSANVSLVARGLSKGTTTDKLSEHLKDSGIETVSISQLTKPEVLDNVNSLTFKVTLKAADLDNALNPSIWPYRCSVRYFRNYRPKHDATNLDNGSRFRGLNDNQQ